MKLVSGIKAAEEMGVSRWFIGAMKKAGAPFYGRKTCVDDLSKWLRANPKFIARDQIPTRANRISKSVT